jgi:hypothetical protein
VEEKKRHWEKRALAEIILGIIIAMTRAETDTNTFALKYDLLLLDGFSIGHHYFQRQLTQAIQSFAPSRYEWQEQKLGASQLQFAFLPAPMVIYGPSQGTMIGAHS